MRPPLHVIHGLNAQCLMASYNLFIFRFHPRHTSCHLFRLRACSSKQVDIWQQVAGDLCHLISSMQETRWVLVLRFSACTVNQLNFAAVNVCGVSRFWVIIGDFPYVVLFNCYATTKLKRSRNVVDLHYQNFGAVRCREQFVSIRGRPLLYLLGNRAPRPRSLIVDS